VLVGIDQYFEMWFQKYIDQVEAHLPFKPSKWERKYKILLLCLVGIFFVAAIVVFALHDQAHSRLLTVR